MTAAGAARSVPDIGARLGAYWSLTKSLQSALLVITAIAGYMSGCCLNLWAAPMSSMVGSMLLAVTGSTVFNMVLDRDIDARMERTSGRPLPSGVIHVPEAVALGAILTVTGVGWAFALLPLYGWLVLAGWVLDVVVYTLLTKRRTPFSILIGGIAGGMPILAGRALATGTVDLIGLLLALGVLLWIPLHILTFAISKQADYARAGVPTFPARYGHKVTRWVISVTILMATTSTLAAIRMLGIPWAVQLVLAGAAVVLASLTLLGLVRPHPFIEFVLYKGASVYMLAAMLSIIFFGL